jgi:hypothetical protein
MKIKIMKPDDTREWYETEITCNNDLLFNNGERVIYGVRTAKDPIHMGIYEFFSNSLGNRSRNFRYLSNTWETTINIGSCPLLLKKSKTRYYINGQVCSFNTLCHALARITYKSCFEKEPIKLMGALYATLALPENIKYCLENRVPYQFYDLFDERADYHPIKVRLNVQQIGPQEMALEVADGVWGNISVKELDKFCNYYVHGKRRGKWVDISPANLYKELMGRDARGSDIDVMLAFLKQNRTRDLVEARAIELVNDMLIEHSGKMKAVWSGDDLTTIFVKGKHYDWKLTNNGYKTDIQMVSTYVWQPTYTTEQYAKKMKEWQEEMEKHAYAQKWQEEGLSDVESEIHPDLLKEPTNDCRWKGPICIDNMASGSPLGDQFAARALALMNDSFTITIVNTIKRYLTGNPNEHRVDLDEML